MDLPLQHPPGHPICPGSLPIQSKDKAPKQAARGPPHPGTLIPCLDLSKFKPQYTEQDEEQAHEWGFTNTDPNSMWKINTQGLILLPEAPVYPIPNTYMKRPITEGML